MYDAFISYSHGKDRDIAAALQSSIQTLGKSWWQRRNLRVFRDETSLTASPELWVELEKRLTSSRFLVLMASPEAAASPWVDKEVSTWLRHHGPEDGTSTLLISLTAGNLHWDSGKGDFGWGPDTPLPPSIRGQFRSEPFWVDLRAYRSDTSNSNKRNKDFAARTGKIAARVLGVPLEDLLSAELSQQRNALRLALGAVLSLLLLAGAVAWLWKEARSSELEARQALSVSDGQRAIGLFTQAGDTDATMGKPGMALAYLARSIRTYPLDGAMGRRALNIIGGFPHLLPRDPVPDRIFPKPRQLSVDERNQNSVSPIITSPDGHWKIGLGDKLTSSRTNYPQWVDVAQPVTMNFWSSAGFGNHSEEAAVAGYIWSEYGGQSVVEIIDDTPRVLAHRFFDGEKISRVLLSPDGHLVVVSLFSPRDSSPGKGDRERTVVFGFANSDSDTGDRVKDLVEIRTLDGASRSAAFSADSRMLKLDDTVYVLGPVVEKELSLKLGNAHPSSLVLSEDGSEIFVSRTEPGGGLHWETWDGATGEKRAEVRVANVPAEVDRSKEFRCEDESGQKSVVDARGKRSAIADRSALLVGINHDGRRFAIVGSDGAMQQVSVDGVSVEQMPARPEVIYGKPWEEGTENFATVQNGVAYGWRILCRSKSFTAEIARKAFGAAVYDVAPGSTDVAVQPLGKVVALGSMGHFIANLDIIQAQSRRRLVPTIRASDSIVESFFSKDGATLFVHSTGTGSSVGSFDMIDAVSGAPLGRSRRFGGPFAESGDGRRLLDGGNDGLAGFIDVLGQAGTVPLWVADLCEAVSALKIDDKGVVSALPIEEQRLRLMGVRAALDAAESDRWTEFGKWYFSSDSNPPISPYSRMRRNQTLLIRNVIAAKNR